MGIANEIIEILTFLFQNAGAFLGTLFGVLTQNLNPVTREALVGFFCLCVCLRVLNGGVRRVEEIEERRARAPLIDGAAASSDTGNTRTSAPCPRG